MKCENLKINVPGFYAGNGIYKVRFLPEIPRLWKYHASGCIQEDGTIDVAPANHGHGLVQTDECHFCYQDGTLFHPFGTTIYALIHQEDLLVAETIATLTNAPFNKIRLCIFPKHYDFNHNEPPFYAFRTYGNTDS